jgi:hypothetical protein
MHLAGAEVHDMDRDGRTDGSGKVASAINLLAGIWLVISTWGFAGGAFQAPVWNAVVAGVLVAIAAMARMSAGPRWAWLSWWNAALGGWMIASPWIYGYTANPGFTWNSVIVGAIVLVLASVSAAAPEAAAATAPPARGSRPVWNGPYYAGPAHPGAPATPYAPEGYGMATVPYTGEDHRGRGPRGYRRPDEAIRADICDRMTDDRELDASNIEVTVRDGEVTLDGTVANRRARRRAEEICDSVTGVRDVSNGLRVPGTSTADGARRIA